MLQYLRLHGIGGIGIVRMSGEGCFDVLNKRFNFKNNTDYCVKIENGNSVVCKYSEKLITHIIALIMDDKDIVIKSK